MRAKDPGTLYIIQYPLTTRFEPRVLLSDIFEGVIRGDDRRVNQSSVLAERA
jgi:hypothetical protein